MRFFSVFVCFRLLVRPPRGGPRRDGDDVGVRSRRRHDTTRYDTALRAKAALLSLSQSVMMLVALSIMTAFLTTCLLLARALMLRGVLAVERYVRFL